MWVAGAVWAAATLVMAGGAPSVSPVPRSINLATAGALEVESAVPGLWVVLDGQAHGRTPLRVLGVSPGLHTVEVRTGQLPVFHSSVEVNGGQTVRVQVPGAPRSGLERLWDMVPRMPAMKMLLAQPWAYAAAALTGLTVVASGVMWTSTPQRVPVVGALPFPMEDWQWTALRWGSLAAVGTLACLTLALFVVPTIPAIQALTDAGAPAEAEPPS